MKQLSYDTLRENGYRGYLLPEAPEHILQFGEGNFLRAFVDYFVDLANERAGFHTKVAVFQPIAEGRAKELNEQDGLYTVYLRGLVGGKETVEKRIVSSISRVFNPYEDFPKLMEYARNPQIRFIVSNTTEAGIVYDPGSLFDQDPPSSFPGKVTRFLYERYAYCVKEKADGFVFLSCELIDYNGQELKRCVDRYIRQWQLGEGFKKWVDEKNIFCSTMVDCIVTGYPHREAEALCVQNGYLDKNLDTGEIFAIWVIEGPQSLEEELPFQKAGLPVVISPDCRPYKQRKVRILNGIQTTMALASYLAGNDIVRLCMEDDDIISFMKKAVYDEILPTLPYPPQELEEYAAEVFDRLRNPFIDHSLLAISLNTTAKWKARVFPSVLEHQKKFGRVPRCLMLGFAAYIAFYHGYRMEGGALINRRGEAEYAIRDDAHVLEFFLCHRDDSPEALADAVCGSHALWGEDLREIPTFAEEAQRQLKLILTHGMHAAIKSISE